MAAGTSEGSGFNIEEMLEWARTEDPFAAAAIFCIINILGTSVIPLPIGVWMMVAAGVLYGQVLGLVLYLSTSIIGAWITFGVVRLVRERIIGMLGKHAETWRRLDAAITREGLWIALLWRVAPIAPYVASSAMISMTDIPMHDYLWTTAIGIIPSSFPVVSGAALADTMLIERKDVDPVVLGINIASLAAGVYVMVRLGAIAMEVLQRDVAANEAADGEEGSYGAANGATDGRPGEVRVVDGAGAAAGVHPSPAKSPAENSARAAFEVLSRALSSRSMVASASSLGSGLGASAQQLGASAQQLGVQVGSTAQQLGAATYSSGKILLVDTPPRMLSELGQSARNLSGSVLGSIGSGLDRLTNGTGSAHGSGSSLASRGAASGPSPGSLRGSKPPSTADLRSLL